MATNNEPLTTDNGRLPAPTRKRRRGWVWFFAILAVLVVAANVILWKYNSGRQLKPEQLAAAKQLWKEKGPRSYDLEYTLKGSVQGTYQVRVRKGEVVYAEPDPRPLEEKEYYYGMPALFRYIETFMKQDAQSDKRVYVHADFDPEDGHLLHYVRRVMGTPERLEITVQLRRLEPK
jgi:hypothetical protein